MSNRQYLKKPESFAFLNVAAAAVARFSAHLFLLATMSAATTVSVCAQGLPADQPILFSANREGNEDIYKMSVDGNNQQRLTDATESDSQAKWSPDGKKIVYTRQAAVGSGLLQIWIMRADGSQKILLSEPNVSSTQPQWSPDGRTIAFVRRESGGKDQIWSMNADGTNKTRLTMSETKNDYLPRWSPDGSRIAFGRCDDTYLLCDLAVVRTTGGLPETSILAITDTSAGAVWTPDGVQIIFAVKTGDIGTNIFSINSDGTNMTQLTFVTSPRILRPVEVSPNGETIGLASSAGNIVNTFEVYLLPVAGGSLLNITNNQAYDLFAKWSPDGNFILFYSRRDGSLGEIFLMRSNGANAVRLTSDTGNAKNITDWRKPLRTAYDFDGDAKADLAVFRPAGGNWFINNSLSGNLSAVRFGAPNDLIAPADYDGDGKTDICVFRPTDGGWYRLNSLSNTFSAQQFGANGDLPVPGDFDGDLRADIAVYRPTAGSWYRIDRSSNQFIAVQFGVAEDKPIAGADFDGDGRADLAVYRPSAGAWYRIESGSGAFSALQFGTAEDKPVAADYDGDGKTDITVYRPSSGNWYRINSSNNSFSAFHFGVAEDKPAPADFDGDGRTDMAVFRPSQGTWYLLRSIDGYTGAQFGTNGDVPVPGAFVR